MASDVHRCLSCNATLDCPQLALSTLLWPPRLPCPPMCPGHGSDPFGCGEFCTTSHWFSVNGKLHSRYLGPRPGSNYGVCRGRRRSSHLGAAMSMRTVLAPPMQRRCVIRCLPSTPPALPASALPASTHALCPRTPLACPLHRLRRLCAGGWHAQRQGRLDAGPRWLVQRP